ncbi:MAG: aldo/keto reductase, partial [Verrucomicrobiales bacterium]
TQGKIRWAGVSNYSASQLERISKLGQVASLQPPYSILNRGVEVDELPWCRANDCGVIVYSPMQCGLLTGKVTKAWLDELPEDDWRKTKNPFFQEPTLSGHLELVKSLQAIAERSGHTVGQLAVAWALRSSDVTAAIVGARRPGQISEILPAGDWSLDEGILSELGEFVA